MLRDHGDQESDSQQESVLDHDAREAESEKNSRSDGPQSFIGNANHTFFQRAIDMSGSVGAVAPREKHVTRRVDTAGPAVGRGGTTAYITRGYPSEREALASSAEPMTPIVPRYFVGRQAGRVMASRA